MTALLIIAAVLVACICMAGGYFMGALDSASRQTLDDARREGWEQGWRAHQNFTLKLVKRAEGK